MKHCAICDKPIRSGVVVDQACIDSLMTDNGALRKENKRLNRLLDSREEQIRGLQEDLQYYEATETPEVRL